MVGLPMSDEPRSRRSDRQRRTRLTVMFLCLSLGGVIVLLIQNPRLTTQSRPGFVGQVSFSPDGTKLAWTSEGKGEGRVIVWDIEHHRQGLTIGPRDSEPERVALSTYTTLAFASDGHVIATGSEFRGHHTQFLTGRLAADSLRSWPDWHEWSFLVFRITSPSGGTAGSRPSFATRITKVTWT